MALKGGDDVPHRLRDGVLDDVADGLQSWHWVSFAPAFLQGLPKCATFYSEMAGLVNRDIAVGWRVPVDRAHPASIGRGSRDAFLNQGSATPNPAIERLYHADSDAITVTPGSEAAPRA